MPLFADRAAAGRELAACFANRAEPDAVVLGIPRGGVIVAAEVAAARGWPLDRVPVRKLGAPGRTEVAVGAIADGVRVLSEEMMRLTGTTAAELSAVEDAERAELARRSAVYPTRGIELSGRVAVVVDDGLATGSTALAACRAVRRHGASRIILAVPVAPFDAIAAVDVDFDEFVCPHIRRDFRSVGQYYDAFPPTTDGEVMRLLARDLPAR